MQIIAPAFRQVIILLKILLDKLIFSLDIWKIFLIPGLNRQLDIDNHYLLHLLTPMG
jgi:hypothetical protein